MNYVQLKRTGKETKLSLMFRFAILHALNWLGQRDLHLRAVAAVGPTGYDTEVHLTKFQGWLLAPITIPMGEVRQGAFRQACIDVLGEDPYEEWT